MKNRILGIAALLAVLVFALMFTTCDLSGLGKSDGITRELTFKNHSKARIEITCQGSTPTSFTLEPATSSLDETKKQLVTREGYDIELTSLALDPSVPDPWLWIDLEGSVAEGKPRKNKIMLGSGTLIFIGAKGEGYNIYGWKIDVLDE